MTEQARVIRVAGEITGAGTFAVRSATDPDQSWTVEWVNARSHWCGCPAFARSRENTCRHVRAVFEAIRGEWGQRRINERNGVTV
jgi:hypothetical protein